MHMKIKQGITFKMASGFDVNEPVKFLEKLGYQEVVPMESGSNYISFTDAQGAGYTARYETTNGECGIVTVSNVVIVRNQLFDQPPINQHDLFEFLRELNGNPDVDTKREVIQRIYEFMNNYR